MKTVGDFYNAGLKFVCGDECDGSNGKMFSKRWVEYSNENDANFVNCTPTKFAWRTNTGVKPSFEGLIDIELDGESVYEREHSSSYWVGGSTDQSVTKWRPALNQSPIQTEMSEAKWIPESKPIFTQAMADAGELPPVGSECTLRYMHDSKTVTHSGVVAYASRKYCILDQVGAEILCKIGDYAYEPIKTEREKAIYAMKDDIREFKGQYVHLDNYDAGKLYDANYRKLTPSQAKAYDDKTEYFGEEYK